MKTDKVPECNCPMCTNEEMKLGEVYRCNKYGGAIMGAVPLDDLYLPFNAIEKIFDDRFDNETHLPKSFINECNADLAPMGIQLNSLLSHPTCKETKCYCGRTPCYYSPLWEKKI